MQDECNPTTFHQSEASLKQVFLFFGKTNAIYSESTTVPIVAVIRLKGTEFRRQYGVFGRQITQAKEKICVSLMANNNYQLFIKKIFLSFPIFLFFGIVSR